MINPINVKEYINFLHLKKYSAPASEELKARWAAVPDYDLSNQIQGLYQHWGIDPATASLYEQLFLQTQSGGNPPPQQPSYQQPSYQPPPVQQQPPAQPYHPPQGKSNKMPVIILSALLLLGAAGFAYYWLNHKNEEPAVAAGAPVTTTTQPVEQPKQNALDPIPAEPTKADESDYSGDVSPDDEANMETIQSLINAEESRNMSAILNSFSSDMEQYWDISYPTQEELVKRYNSVWTKSGNGKHTNIRLEKEADHTYDLYANYEFYSVKDHISKAVAVHVRYVFDDNNKIIKTFGVK